MLLYIRDGGGNALPAHGRVASVEGLIAEGLDYFNIPCVSATLERLSFFVCELQRWNSRFNLTAKKQAEPIVRELLCDTFFLFGHIKGISSALDMGSGSGALAIPLAILDETMQIFSVDRTLRKIQFQRHIKRGLQLDNLSTVHGRIEDLEHLGVDALLAKGFGGTKSILEKGGGHLREGGVAYLLKGRTERKAHHSGFSLERALEYRLPNSPKEFQLFVYKKVP